MKLFASLSEAIREGAKLSPQAFGGYMKDGGTCALGAASKALRIGVHNFIGLYPYIAIKVKCPVCAVPWCMPVQIVHLNDDHKWTRERIADWLESEEEKLGFVTLVESAEVTEPMFVGVGHSDV